MVSLCELQIDLDKTFPRLVSEYCNNERLILTESDMVNRAYYFIQESGILEKHSLAIHSELRPYDFKDRKAIHDGSWSDIDQINHAAKFDLALVDASDDYWDQAHQYILCSQSKTRKKKRIRYWRFLVYPLKAFKAAFEFKIRVQGNKDNILKDVDKLSLLDEKNKCCLKYLIILDRKAPERTIKSIKDYARQFERFQIITHKSSGRNKDP